MKDLDLATTHYVLFKTMVDSRYIKDVFEELTGESDQPHLQECEAKLRWLIEHGRDTDYTVRSVSIPIAQLTNPSWIDRMIMERIPERTKPYAHAVAMLLCFYDDDLKDAYWEEWPE